MNQKSAAQLEAAYKEAVTNRWKLLPPDNKETQEENTRRASAIEAARRELDAARLALEGTKKSSTEPEKAGSVTQVPAKASGRPKRSPPPERDNESAYTRRSFLGVAGRAVRNTAVTIGGLAVAVNQMEQMGRDTSKPRNNNATAPINTNSREIDTITSDGAIRMFNPDGVTVVFPRQAQEMLLAAIHEDMPSLKGLAGEYLQLDRGILDEANPVLFKLTRKTLSKQSREMMARQTIGRLSILKGAQFDSADIAVTLDDLSDYLRNQASGQTEIARMLRAVAAHDNPAVCPEGTPGGYRAVEQDVVKLLKIGKPEHYSLQILPRMSVTQYANAVEAEEKRLFAGIVDKKVEGVAPSR